MIIQIYSIKDNVSGFTQPTFELYEPAALRNFSFAVNQSGMMNFKPEDYSLWHVGTFDSETGVIDPVDPKLIVHGSEVVRND